MKTTPCVLVGLLSLATASFAKTPQKAADYIAHEWGTFTSVQAHDGIQLEWNPFITEDLPDFVYNSSVRTTRERKVVLPQTLFFGKSGMLSKQRMETPVIYFYADKPQKVDVSVEFPTGRFTEWFPQLTVPRQGNTGRVVPVGQRSTMHWGDLDILPGNGRTEEAHFPQDKSGSHYYAARETDASAVRITGADGKAEYEKFLFYRGVAGFDAPLRVRHWGDQAQTIRLTNESKSVLPTAFVYAVRGDRAALHRAGALDPGVSLDVPFDFNKLSRPLAEVRAELGNQLRAALTSEGLYPKEAASMVKTWEDAWMGEPGTRVLYTLPQAWTDQILPLRLAPAPKELKRVFVGRAELITPAQEWAFLKEVARYAEGGSLDKQRAITSVKQLGLGRFIDAAARHLSTVVPNTPEFSLAVSAILDGSRAAAEKPANATAARKD